MRFISLSVAMLATASARTLPKRNEPAGTLTTSFPNPNIDPFYSVPWNIAIYEPGEVIRSRKVATTITGLAVNSYEVFYRTSGNFDQATGTVATIWAPAVPRSPPSILSYQFPEDALNQACAPSWAYVNESSTYEEYVSEDGDITIPWGLSQGYYVVNADDEGPDSQWLVGRMEGHAVLDGIRATINYLSLPIDSSVALYGYSGGAHETVWGCTLAASYAPELNIIGAAYGGTPTYLLPNYYLLNGGPDAILAGASIIGLSNGYPELNETITKYLTPNGTAVDALLRSPDFCTVTDAAVEEFAYFNFSSLYTVDVFTLPITEYVQARESLLMNTSNFPVPVPKFPRLEYHGEADTTVPYLPELEYVEQQCAHGADIRFVSLPGLDHDQTELDGIAGAFQFIQQAFAGTLAKVECGSNVTLPALGSAESVEVVGLDYTYLIEALFEVASE